MTARLVEARSLIDECLPIHDFSAVYEIRIDAPASVIYERLLDPRAGVRNQLCKGPQQRIHNEIHAQVLGKCQGGFTQCIGFRPCRFSFGKVLSNLVFCLSLGGDFLRSSLQGGGSYRNALVPGIHAL